MNIRFKVSFLFMFAAFLLPFGCANKSISQHEAMQVKALESRHFSEKRGCFLLYNIKKGAFDQVIGDENCKERLVACSTFKLPLALMAFDSGVLKDETQTLEWDGKRGVLASHNQDHNAKSWVKESVVWFSQRLTPQIGEVKIKRYLHGFHYGNEDFSAGLKEAWLVSPRDAAPSLKISGYEQAEFMKKLWADKLPVSKRAMGIVREISYLETSPKGFRLSGKTGSNFYESDKTLDQRRALGWFVGHLQGQDQEYIVVSRFSDLTPFDATKYGGPRAKQIAKDILSEQGLW